MTPNADPESRTCERDDSCPGGYSCVDGKCHRQDDPRLDGGGSPLDAVANVLDVSLLSDTSAAMDVSRVADTETDAPMPGSGGAGGTTTSTGRIVGTGGRIVGIGGTTAGTGGVVGMGGAPVGTGGTTGVGTGGTSMPSTCPQPTDPNHGSVKVSALTLGSTATYSCSDGYRLSGVSQRTCQADSTWSDAAPTCAPVDCGPPPPPANGKVEAPATTFQSIATYSCSANHGLSGDQQRTCRADGTWSGTVPTCQCVQTMCNGACVDLQTDNANCGDCGSACSAVAPSTAQCASARCLVTLATPAAPSAIAVDASHVYWTDINVGQPGTVMKVPLSGGVPTTIATGQNYAEGIAVDANYVYWTAWNDSRVMKAPLAGGAASIVADEENAPCGIAVDANNLYWGNGRGYIMQKSLSADDAHSIAAQAESCIVVIDATNVYYVGSSPSATIMKLRLELDATPTTLATGEEARGIAVDATSVYWTGSDGTVKKMPIAGGTPTILVSDQGTPRGIAVDESHVYWTTSNGAVRKLPIGGGTPVTLASDQVGPGRVVVDSTSVYWLNASYVASVPGSVMKTRK